MYKFLYWSPRILTLLFIVFTSVFILDAFSSPQWYIALPMHLIPSFILILLAVIAWHHQKNPEDYGKTMRLLSTITLSPHVACGLADVYTGGY